MPEFPIIDTHIHFWDGDAVPVDWLASAPAISRPHRPVDLVTQSGDVEIEKLIFVEADVAPGHHIAEVDWVAGLADAEPRIAGIVAHAPLERGEQAEGDLKALAERPLVRGVRRLLQAEEDTNFCLRPEFVDGVRRLPGHGFHFEICILHHQLAAATELARRCPEVSFILDHIGKPGIKAGLREPWRAEIVALAKLPNVVCKLSGVATEADHNSWTKEQLLPYITHVLSAFGPDRVMFGGDWPVSTLAIEYPAWVGLVDEAVADWSERDQQKLYRDNAIAFYRL